ncbi:hypothetical protein HWV62_3324 [Athelia sp. TMB]|nr:hypothetical protein HWV62_3324 [Athelia sp. TMB]
MMRIISEARLAGQGTGHGIRGATQDNHGENRGFGQDGLEDTGSAIRRLVGQEVRALRNLSSQPEPRGLPSSSGEFKALIWRGRGTGQTRKTGAARYKDTNNEALTSPGQGRRAHGRQQRAATGKGLRTTRDPGGTKARSSSGLGRWHTGIEGTGKDFRTTLDPGSTRGRSHCWGYNLWSSGLDRWHTDIEDAGGQGLQDDSGLRHHRVFITLLNTSRSGRWHMGTGTRTAASGKGFRTTHTFTGKVDKTARRNMADHLRSVIERLICGEGRAFAITWGTTQIRKSSTGHLDDNTAQDY